MNFLLLRNSLLVSGATTLLAAGFGFLAALWLSALGGRSRMLVLGVALAALAMPPFLATNCWLHYLGYTGVWHGWLPLDIFSIGGTIWILSLLLWPIPMLALLGAWRRLEPAQLESDMAVTGKFLMLGLLVPLGRSAIVQSALLVFVLALNNFAVPAILQVKVFPAETWVRFNTTFDLPGVLALSWPLVAGPLLLLAWLRRKDVPWPHLSTAVPGRLLRQQLGSVWFYVSGIVTLLLCFFSVGLPLFQLLATPATWTELPGAAAAGHAAALNSTGFAAIAATLVVTLAVFAGALKSRGMGNSAQNTLRTSDFGLRTFLWLPFLLPGVLLGLALIVVFNHPWSVLLYQSPLIVILAYLIRYFAWGQTTVAHALHAADPCLTDAALLDGASRWQMLRHVQWPQIGPQVAAAWYIVFLLCLWDVESMILVTPPGGETLALRIFNLLHYGHNAQVNALCVMLLAIALAPWAAWQMWRTLRRCEGRRPKVVRRPKAEIRNPKEGRSQKSEGRVRGLKPESGSLEAVCEGNVMPQSREVERGHYCPPNSPVRTERRPPVGLGQTETPEAPFARDADIVSRAEPGAPFSTEGLQGHSDFAFRPSFGLRPSDFGFSKASLSIIIVLCFLVVGCGGDSASSRSLRSKIFSRIEIIGSRGVGVGQFNKPRSVAVDAHDNLYVVDMTGRVQKFSSNGIWLLSWQMPVTDKGCPKGLCCDRDGNVVVNEPHYSRVSHFSPEGALAAQWGSHGTNAGQLAFPRDVTVNSRNEIWVSEYGITERIQRFSARGGGFLGGFGRMGGRPGEFNRPEGLGVDSRDRLYVADSCNHRIQVFDENGVFLRAYGKAGAGPGELGYPYDICVDAKGLQYVCEFGNSRIQVFDEQDRPVEIIGGPGAAPGQFNNPWGVALDSAGNLYVADSQNHRVQKLVRRP